MSQRPEEIPSDDETIKFQKKLEAKDHQIDELLMQILTLETENPFFQKLQEKNEEIATITKNFTEIKENLESQLKILSEEMKIDQALFDQEKSSLQKQLEEKTLDIEELLQNIALLEEKLDWEKRGHQETLNKLSDLEKELEEETKLHKETEDEQFELNKQKTQLIEIASKEAQEHLKVIFALDCENVDLKKENNGLKEKIREYETKWNEMAEKLRCRDEEIKRNKREFLKETQMKLKFQYEVEENQSFVEKMEAEYSELKEKNEENWKVCDGFKRTIEENEGMIKNLQEKLFEKEKECTFLKEQLISSQKEVESLKSEQLNKEKEIRKEEELDRKEQRLYSTKSELLINKKSEASAKKIPLFFENESSCLKTEPNDYRTESDCYKLNLSERLEFEQLKIELTAFRKALQVVSEALNSKENEFHAMENENNNLKQNILNFFNERTIFQSQIMNYQTAFANKEVEILNYQRFCHNLKEEFNEKMKVWNQRELLIKELNTEIISLKHYLKSAEIELNCLKQQIHLEKIDKADLKNELAEFYSMEGNSDKRGEFFFKKKMTDF